MSHDSQQLGIDPALVREEQNSRTFCLCGRNPRQRCFSRGADYPQSKYWSLRRPIGKENVSEEGGRKELLLQVLREESTREWRAKRARRIIHIIFYNGHQEIQIMPENKWTFMLCFWNKKCQEAVQAVPYKGVPYKPYSVYCKKNWDTNWQ